MQGIFSLWSFTSLIASVELYAVHTRPYWQLSNHQYRHPPIHPTWRPIPHQPVNQIHWRPLYPSQYPPQIQVARPPPRPPPPPFHRFPHRPVAVPQLKQHHQIPTVLDTRQRPRLFRKVTSMRLPTNRPLLNHHFSLKSPVAGKQTRPRLMRYSAVRSFPPKPELFQYLPQKEAYFETPKQQIRVTENEAAPYESPRSADGTTIPDFDGIDSQNASLGRLGRQYFGLDHTDQEETECTDNQICRTSFQCEAISGASTGDSCGKAPGLFCCDLSSNDIEDTNSTRSMKSDPFCGRSRERTKRIVGGFDADFGEYPWQVYLRIGESRCGGAILNSIYVVTAAHCVNGKTTDQIKVYLGELVLGQKVEELPHELRYVREITVHPEYMDLSIDSHDVALLRLDRPIDYRTNIMPICLPEPGEEFTGNTGVVTGWGRKYPDSDYKSDHLQAVEVPVIENSQCKRWLRLKRKYAGIRDDHVCAGYAEGGRDSCRGDSGGPLATQINGRWYLIGLVSAGYSCSKPLQPGIYHRVSKTVEWITKHAFK